MVYDILGSSTHLILSGPRHRAEADSAIGQCILGWTISIPLSLKAHIDEQLYIMNPTFTSLHDSQ